MKDDRDTNKRNRQENDVSKKDVSKKDGPKKDGPKKDVLDDETQVEPIYTEGPEVEVSYEALSETIDGDPEEEALQNIIDTQHTDGSTDNPFIASEQGMVYTPPTDPPVLPSDDLQGVDVATGFAQSMEASDPDVEELPDRVDNQDLDLEDDVRVSLRNNSETSKLDDIRVRVRNGVVLLAGTVFSQDDIGLVEEQIRDLDGVVEVVNELTVAPEST